jgi:hypothetical protein
MITGIKILNNWNVKRSFSNKLWYRKGVMFPFKKLAYLQIGFFGLIITIQYNSKNGTIC